MLFRLALAMGRTIEELRAVLSYNEFCEWCLYYQIEPWGESRADLRSGIIASTMHNMYAAWVGSSNKAKPSDYMPYIEIPEDEPVVPSELSGEELARWADAAIFGLTPEQ